MIVERYWPKVRSLIRRTLSNRETVEDLCQETFIKAFEKIDQFDTTRNFCPWLLKIGVNLVGEHFRRSGNKLQLVSWEETTDISILAGPGERVSDRMLIDEYLEKLPVFLRILFVLKHGLMLSYEEMAQVLDEPVGSIKGNLNRARACLKSHFAEVTTLEKADQGMKTK